AMVSAVLVSAAPASADARIGKFTVTFAEGVFHRNGDFVIPGAVRGVSADGDFKADRAFGNYQRQDVTLVGHVMIHQRVAGGASGELMTLTAQQVRIAGKPSSYTATGSVVVVQANRRLHADYLQLNEATHQGLLRGNVSVQENDRVVNSAEIHYNTLTGAIEVPAELTGFSSDTDFRADRGFGNQKAGTFTMIGNVVVHRFGNYGKANNSTEPLTLWCDKLDIVQRPQTTYTATGHVKVAQGDRTLVAPVLTLNDTTHVATMTGGVHGEERPDRTFDAAELLYNTQTEDFKALGGVKATFPFRRASSGPSPTPSARPSAAVPQNSSPTPLPAPTRS
ncbi:MAG: LptA/OstA family protein, partial [Candidatus Eremiobacteraeota bacterium]|nr:LptA/OstA family protein [Candidatus Eremiobacteraeota bacterium]